MMKHQPIGYLTTAALVAGLAATVQAKTKTPMEVARTSSGPAAVISSTTTVPFGMKTVYISGTTASPVNPAVPEDLGDTRVQTISVLTKIKAQLETMGMGMGDIVKMTVFLVAPTPGGRMDSAAMNDVFKTFFGTPEQPNKPARSTIQIAALGRPTTYVEIEAVAAKVP